MILSITTTHQPATDMGYLLHKHPERLQSVELAVGKVHVFYPEANAERATACLLLELDAVTLAKGNSADSGFALGQYVNDRPYVASSFMSVAIAKAYSSALNGHCKERPELVDVLLPVEVRLAAVAAPQGGAELIRKLFEPLGYEVSCKGEVLDDKFPEWGDSKYYQVQLRHSIRMRDLLRHLYVLLPALDKDKHYFVGEGEVEKLLEKGTGWLEGHAMREQIVKRYLKDLGGLSRQALLRLRAEEEEDEGASNTSGPERAALKSLHDKRLEAVVEVLAESGTSRVLDLGCGEGKLIRLLLKVPQFKEIAGMDVSYGTLLKAKERLHYAEMAPRQKERLKLFQGSLTYRDKRLAGYEAAAVVEVIEHLDLERLAAFERVLFEFARPGLVVLTTPNKDYNVVYEMEEAELRHPDHRFEWTQAEFEAWGKGVAERYGYMVRFAPIGESIEGAGAPSQMAVFNYGN